MILKHRVDEKERLFHEHCQLLRSRIEDERNERNEAQTARMTLEVQLAKIGNAMRQLEKIRDVEFRKDQARLELLGSACAASSSMLTSVEQVVSGVDEVANICQSMVDSFKKSLHEDGRKGRTSSDDVFTVMA
jgi:hypothetical protein